MGMFIFKVIYFFSLAMVLAVLEIQIEGPDGWAKNLPTWRPSRNRWFVKLFKKISQDKEFTGYHFFLSIFLLLMVHLPFVWTGTWSVEAELELLAFYVVFVVTWDFLWFVLNPHRSLRDFNPQNVWWHKRWALGMPVDYLYGFLLSVLLFVPLIINDAGNFIYLVVLLAGNMILTVITVLLYPKAY